MYVEQKIVINSINIVLNDPILKNFKELGYLGHQEGF